MASRESSVVSIVEYGRNMDPEKGKHPVDAG
jgi:hypothetical protein